VEFAFDDEKNDWLQLTRGVTFHDVIEAIASGELLDMFENPNQVKYPGQFIIVVRINNYPHCVPSDIDGGVYHLRTVYPCRRFKHLLKEEQNGK
jgi:hypothetical protein